MIRSFPALLLVASFLNVQAADPKPWPAKIPAPNGMEKAPGPWNDPDTETAWPNTKCRANGDPWLMSHHDKLTVMRPRVLVLNFSNEHSRDHLDRLTARLIAALAESTKYHGYQNPKVTAFLQYEVFKFVDLRDGDRKQGNSRQIPVKTRRRSAGST